MSVLGWSYSSNDIMVKFVDNVPNSGDNLVLSELQTELFNFKTYLLHCNYMNEQHRTHTRPSN